MSDTALVWFRRDLRLHDHEALTEAAAADRVVPVYAFDPRAYGSSEFGGGDSFRYEKTGGFRARFRRESVADLRDSLRDRGADLVVREGPTEHVVAAVADHVDADTVHFHTWPCPEEAGAEAAVREALRGLDGRVDTRRYWGHTLYHINDLPSDYRNVADTYTAFRTSVESDASVRPPLGIPDLPPLPDDAPAPGDVPTPADLGVDDPATDDRGVLPFEGGESAALDRIERYLWDEDRLREYKETRNGMLGQGYSSKLSPWLNEGCLSPRYVHDEVDRYEDLRVSNESTYWLVFELLWRDFYQFQFAKHGATFFDLGGIRGRTDIDWRDPAADDAAARAFERWAAGETGIPFVDANMRELNRTGYMSNRGRQVVASFLANNLRVDWRRGAAHFETRLVDYDPASNYGNWAYVAGVGNDSRDRYFNVVKQARNYDGAADYVTHWLPELDPLSPEYAHEPWKLSSREQAEHGVELGIDYPEPVVDLERSYEKLR
ncbi:MAG: deoxyribodipyrimidine photo-lyase (single-stranded DNA-specific) [uncultured archaeon A07HB70]|nr:MAG: deoxyribodipyrimidine photo-lyase (single-stranded DNA-specific) [uncultured archaeon A07HB70]